MSLTLTTFANSELSILTDDAGRIVAICHTYRQLITLMSGAFGRLVSDLWIS